MADSPVIRRFLLAFGLVETAACFVGAWVAGWRGIALVAGGMAVERIIGPSRRLVERVQREYAAAECTGITATWCPLHGECTCEDRNDLNDDDCPLHGVVSTHAAS